MENNNNDLPDFIRKKIEDKPVSKPVAEKQRNKMSFKAKLKVAAVGLIVLIGLIFWGAYELNQWFNTHTLKFQSPIQTPVKVEARVSKAKSQENYLVSVAEAKSNPILPRYKDEIDQYIYEKFGKDGDLAVRIARAENGTGQCDRTNVNKNGSIDVGRFMINSIHWGKYPLAKLVDCKYNVDVAFQIYSEQGGFQAWTVYKNGSYKLVDIKNYLN